MPHPFSQKPPVHLGPHNAPQLSLRELICPLYQLIMGSIRRFMGQGNGNGMG